MTEYITPTSTIPEAYERPTRMTVPLLVVAGSTARLGKDARIHILGDSLRLGRASASTDHLRLDSSSTSREHAVVLRDGDAFLLQDLGSRNGTYVDGKMIRGQCAALRDGSMIFLGGYLMFFRRVTPEMNRALAEEQQAPVGPIQSRSPRLCVVNRRLRLLNSSDAMLVGETGTGKDVYARALHRLSGRRGSFVALNCASVPKTLAESELFGYLKGAHSQAVDRKAGLIEAADGGTLFLDELGEMPMDVQAKLLRFLQAREFLPLGATTASRIDVKIIAATNRTVDDSRVRRDLRHRLGEPISLPPLRRRREDLPSLIGHFLGDDRQLTTLAFQALLSYGWPGNIRELEQSLARASLLSERARTLDLCHFPGAIGGYASQVEESGPADHGTAAFPYRNRPEAIPAPQRRRSPRPRPPPAELERLLGKHDGRVADVARELERRWQVVWKWIRADDLDPSRYRRTEEGADGPAGTDE